MPKADGQSSRITKRFSSPESARGAALIDPETIGGPDDAFYRPATQKPPSSSRPFPGDFPFREGGSEVEDGEAPFLRSRRRVAVRKGVIPRNLWGRIAIAAGAVTLVAGITWLGFAIHSFAAHDPRFRIDSSDNIQILGNSEVTRSELLGVFGGDMGRNVFFIPLKERCADLERLPWVESATVMRLLPDQLRISVVERTPVAFVRNGNTIGLVDHRGVLLTMDPKTMAQKHYSFPVVTGVEANDPLSTRAPRMAIYQRFITDLDSSGEHFSTQLSEIDLSDPEDVKAYVPSGSSDLLLHFGEQDFLTRWRNYQQHLAEWKAQYPRLASVDLRYERQVVLQMQKGASIEPNQDATGKTIDDLKAEASAITPTAARQMAAAAKRPPKKIAPPKQAKHRHGRY